VITNKAECQRAYYEVTGRSGQYNDPGNAFDQDHYRSDLPNGCSVHNYDYRIHYTRTTKNKYYDPSPELGKAHSSYSPICRDTTDWQPDKPVKAWNRLGATVSTEGQKDGINPPRLISSSKITLADGHWHHIALSVKSESLECFSLVDGIKTSWECGAFVIQTGGTVVLGSDQGNLAGGSFEARNAFYGRISRVLVYTAALNQFDLSMKTTAVGEAPIPYKTFADFSFLGGTKLLPTDLKVKIKNCPPGGGYLGEQSINATSNAANMTNATINIKGSGENPVTLQIKRTCSH
jgi:hypothetical protein